eukprot:m.69146 g.69146  ORF g.69146 m.69146 type:complete len:304 (-) comp8562_c0_seq1:1996-2907(-)
MSGRLPVTVRVWYVNTATWCGHYATPMHMRRVVRGTTARAMASTAGTRHVSSAHPGSFTAPHELNVDKFARRVDAFIPGGSHVVTRPSVLVGSSVEVDKTSTLFGGVFPAILRKLRGGTLFMDLVRARGRDAGSAVLAPQDGLATAIPVTPGAKMIVRTGAFLACSSGVKIANRARRSVVDEHTLEISGGGTVVVSSLGEGVIVDLKPQEEYLVLRQHLIAWDALITTRIVDDPDSIADNFSAQLRSFLHSTKQWLLGREVLNSHRCLFALETGVWPDCWEHVDSVDVHTSPLPCCNVSFTDH